MFSIWVPLFVCCCFLSNFFVRVTSAYDNQHFTNEWAVEIPGGLRVARDVAGTHGFRVIRAFASFPDHYLLDKSDTPHRSRRSARHHTRKLAEDERVTFVEQQQHLLREKRGVLDPHIARELAARSGDLHDPEFSQEWYINQADSKIGRRDTSPTDLRVRDVWKRGITGKGVVITIIDDGLERTHPDIKDNYDPLASTDLNGHDDDPSPRYDPTNENKHGTRCAGVISMVANNNICGVGIAFDSKIGGIRILDGNVTDHSECEALTFRPQHIDIYSASWGPKDNGKNLDGPRTLSRKALIKGVTEGRKGKGSIFVWASGNGGQSGDNCNADGYVSAIETISVSSSSQEGKMPYYAEKCASTLTTSYSSGTYMEGRVVSTDIHHLCTESHTGTSAASPMVVGIIALLLEVNPNITWRDVQHIIAHTSRMQPLALNDGWYKNGAGYCVNLAFGFGLVDALAAVELGNPTTWRNVGKQRICKVDPVVSSRLPSEFVSGQWLEIEFQTNGCAGKENEINYLEHIQVVFDAEHERRGNIYAEIESAMGTVTPLMLERKKDDSKKGFRKWPLMSMHNWGEKPHGTWKFRVADRSKGHLKGKVKAVRLILYGTREQPVYQKTSPRNCVLMKHNHVSNHGSGAGKSVQKLMVFN